MIQNIEKFIAFLIDSGYTKQSSVFLGRPEDWEYYYNIIGNIDGKYFSITFSKLKESDIHFADIARNVTECEDVLMWLANEFGL